MQDGAIEPKQLHQIIVGVKGVVVPNIVRVRKGCLSVRCCSFGGLVSVRIAVGIP